MKKKSFNYDAPLAKFKPPVVDVEQAIRSNVGCLKAVTPRFVARALGLDRGNVTACFKRLTALGVLERIARNGEWYYRKGRWFGLAIPKSK